MAALRRSEAWRQALQHENGPARRKRLAHGSRFWAGMCVAVIACAASAVWFHRWGILSTFRLGEGLQGRKWGPDIAPRMYAVDLAVFKRTSVPSLASAFVQLKRDAATNTFLAAAAQEGLTREGLEMMNARFKQFLRAMREQGMSRTDASAKYLNRTMLVGTPQQFRTLLVGGGVSSVRSLLDIGSGQGAVTASLAEAMGLNATQVTAMESSSPLRHQLAQAGYHTISGFTELAGHGFGAVAVLNVLDRCDDPSGLLRAAVDALEPHGFLLVATVLPFCGKVYIGKKGETHAHRPPSKPLALPPGARCGSDPFEKNVASFAAYALSGLPLRIVAWTRVPYLSSGGAQQSHYMLDNALFLLRKAAGGAVERPRNVGQPVASARLDASPLPRSALPTHTLPSPAATNFGMEAFTRWWRQSIPSDRTGPCASSREGKRLRWLAKEVQRIRGPKGWGDVLDAGTGQSSICWLVRQRPCQSVTGVTAVATGGIYGHASLQDAVRATVKGQADAPAVRVLLGNWRNSSLLLHSNSVRSHQKLARTHACSCARVHTLRARAFVFGTVTRWCSGYQPGMMLCPLALADCCAALESYNYYKRALCCVVMLTNRLLASPGCSSAHEHPPACPDFLACGQTREPQQFDVVLIDYLLAAVHMHWPFAEDEVLWRVLQAVRPNGGLALLTGIEPYELVLDPANPEDEAVLEVEALGDAAALLANRRSYREVPQEWVLRQVGRLEGFRVLASESFPMSITSKSLRSQLSFARREAHFVADGALRQALLASVRRLETLVKAQATRIQGRTRGTSYAIVVQRD